MTISQCGVCGNMSTGCAKMGLKALPGIFLLPGAAERLQVDHTMDALHEVCFADGLQAFPVQASARRVDHGDDAAVT
eukprot:CAMPEP_0118884270 /NCGR_PEP_ID=MMETSP1163-20130328/23153_1 /TAXON_ID=124430 /ORGANISM="Phaeomonas parva, Strain CCMP2877" /LENGTH=76 /DNA_ID=CAMNT_0006821983 /DNA_START=16 /DNA_END=241 /DNA_ORIENTATION=-